MTHQQDRIGIAPVRFFLHAKDAQPIARTTKSPPGREPIGGRCKTPGLADRIRCIRSGGRDQRAAVVPEDHRRKNDLRTVASRERPCSSRVQRGLGSGCSSRCNGRSSSGLSDSLLRRSLLRSRLGSSLLSSRSLLGSRSLLRSRLSSSLLGSRCLLGSNLLHCSLLSCRCLLGGNLLHCGLLSCRCLLGSNLLHCGLLGCRCLLGNDLLSCNLLGSNLLCRCLLGGRSSLLCSDLLSGRSLLRSGLLGRGLGGRFLLSSSCHGKLLQDWVSNYRD